MAGREVAISNPAKVLFPKPRHTKLDLARYYVAVAEGALRGAGGRPNMLVRYPDGIDGEFFYQTYSRPVTSPAGETQDNSEYIGQFSFISTRPSAEQPGLFMSVSPDSNEGSRMQYVGLEDTAQGIRVTVIDTPEADGEFVEHTNTIWRLEGTFA